MRDEASSAAPGGAGDPPRAAARAVPGAPSASSPEEISYRGGARTALGRRVISLIENATGRPRLLRMAEGYQAEVGAQGDFWAVMLRRYGVRLELPGPGRAHLPAQGPLVVVANHPFGILDGLILGGLLSEARGGAFKVLANAVFLRAPEVERRVLPVDFAPTRAAQARNLETRRAAIAYLRAGGCVGVFPGGAVSTAADWFGPARDPAWKTFTARLIRETGATVVPIHFDGANSRLFQIASHVSPTLRLALLIREFGRAIRRPVRVSIGAPLPAAALAAEARDPIALMRRLRRASYALAAAPQGPRGPALGKTWE